MKHASTFSRKCIVMDYALVLVLAFLQGLLEWWPISSQGQLTLVLLKITQDPSTVLTLVMWLHLGTMMVVLVVFRHRFLRLLARPIDQQLWALLLLSAIGTGVSGIPLYILVKDAFQVVNASALSLGVGGLLFVTGGLLHRTEKVTDDFRGLSSLKYCEMLLLGAVQGIAILPGISRSGITLAYLLIRRFRKEEAIEGSFLISVPAVLGGFVIDGLTRDMSVVLHGELPILLIIGVLTTFIVGLASMGFFLRFARRVRFSILCFALGSLVILGESITWGLLLLGA